MKPSTILPLAVCGVATATATAPWEHRAGGKADITVLEAPDFVRPYVLPKYRGKAIKLTPSQIIRYSITANSSGGAFSLIQHNGKDSGYPSARPHTHAGVHEHFYCSKGRVQLWGKKNATGASHEARVGTAGDYGNVPPGAIHTFQLTAPDTQLTHVFHPAGFEHLFEVFSLGEWPTEGVSAPFLAIPEDDPPFGPLTPDMDALLRGLDLVAAEAEEYLPRRDFVNGTAGDDDSLSWHDGPNELPMDNTLPYFVAKDYGPKYLNRERGTYQIVQPLTTAEQATHHNFTMGTIILSPPTSKNATVPVRRTLPHHFAIQMEDGELALSVDGYGAARMIQGDVAFVPANVSFAYEAGVPFTKFLYMNAGAEGLDYELLRGSEPWGWTAYPEE